MDTRGHVQNNQTKSKSKFPAEFKITACKAGKIAWWLRALAAHEKDLAWVPRPHKVTQSHLSPVPGDLIPSSGLLSTQRTYDVQTYIQSNIHIKNLFFGLERWLSS